MFLSLYRMFMCAVLIKSICNFQLTSSFQHRQKIVVSSAYISTLPDLTEAGKSYAYIENSLGQRVHPGGTPKVTFPWLEIAPPTSVHCLRSDRLFWTHTARVPEMPLLCSLSRSTLWSIVSKAFWKSIKIIPYYFS